MLKQPLPCHDGFSFLLFCMFDFHPFLVFFCIIQSLHTSVHPAWTGSIKLKLQKLTTVREWFKVACVWFQTWHHLKDIGEWWGNALPHANYQALPWSYSWCVGQSDGVSWGVTVTLYLLFVQNRLWRSVTILQDCLPGNLPVF